MSRAAHEAIRAVVLGSCLAACEEPAPPSVSGPAPSEEPPVRPEAAQLESAIAAHGGREALARLDDLRVASRVTFRDGVELERELHFRAPSSLAMTIAQDGRVLLAFGLAGDRCWQTHRVFAPPCRPDDVEDHRRIVDVLIARGLHRLDPSAVGDAGTVEIDGRTAPAIRAGDLRLAFDPERRLLVRVDYEQRDEAWVESFSGFEEHQGALVAARRVLTIDGEPDVTETWTEIVPGGADPARFVPPAPPTPGTIFDGEDGERAVVIVAMRGEELTTVRREAEAFLEGRGMHASHADGLILLSDGRVAMTAESDRRHFEASEAGAFALVTWPAGRYVGLYVRGAVGPEASRRLAAVVRERGHRTARGATAQHLLAPGEEEQPEAERFGLLRIAIEP